MIQRFFHNLDNASKLVLVTLSFFLVVLLGVTDAATGHEVSLTIFYLLPIALVSWFVNKWAGLCFSLVSASVWLIADSLSGHLYSYPLMLYWNAISHTEAETRDRKSTRLNSSHSQISYAVFCLKKK